MGILLALDVGNTNVVIGAYRGATLVRTWRAATAKELQTALAEARVGPGQVWRVVRPEPEDRVAVVAVLPLEDALAGDDVLVERVRAQLGRLVSHPHAIDVEAVNGRVTLRGPILQAEVNRLLRASGRVRAARTCCGRRGGRNDHEEHRRGPSHAAAPRPPAVQGGRHLEGHQVIQVAETGIDGLKVPEAAHEQPGAEQEQEAQGDLRRHQALAQARRPAASGERSRGVLQGGPQIRTARTERRQKAKEQRGNKGEPQGEQENPQIRFRPDQQRIPLCRDQGEQPAREVHPAAGHRDA